MHIFRKPVIKCIAAHGELAILVAKFWRVNDVSKHLIQHIILHWPSQHILIAIADDDPVMPIKCQQWGAMDFFSRQARQGVVREAVSTLIDGLGWFISVDDQASASPIRKNRRGIGASQLGRTVRQALGKLPSGLPNKNNMKNLNLPKAIGKKHVICVSKELGFGTRFEAISKCKHRRSTAE